MKKVFNDKDFKKLGINPEFKIFSCLKSVSSKKRIIEGYASVAEKDRDGDIITIEALKKAKKKFLEKGIILYNHDRAKPIGKLISADVDKKGLKIVASISKAPDVEDIWIKIKEGILNSFSIGGRMKKIEAVRDDKGEVSHYEVKEIEIYETSVVSVPANQMASITEVIEKSLGEKGRKNMKNKKKTKQKKTVTKTPDDKKDVFGKEQVEEMLKENNKKMDEKFGEIRKAIDSMFKVMKKSLKQQNTKKDTEKSKKKDKDLADKKPSWAESIEKELNSIKKLLNKKPSRKGYREKELDNDNDGKPSLVFKDENDPKTIASAIYVMKNKSAYDKLEDDEKAMAKSIYFRILHKQSRVDK